MRTTMGVLGVVGLGVSVALAQTDVVPAGGVIPNTGVIPAGGVVPNYTAPTPAGAVTVPSVPATDDPAPLSHGLGKLRSAFTGQSQAANAPNANSPFQSTSPTGSTVYAGPPAYRWYGWGTVTPGANPSAPTGQYPKASANWYSITGATPGAFPTPVTSGQPVLAGPEPPSYANVSPPRPSNSYTGPAPSTMTAGTVAPASMPAPAPVHAQNTQPQAAIIPPPTMTLPPPSSVGMPMAPVAPATIAAPLTLAAPAAPIASPPGLPALADPALPGLKSHLPPGPVVVLPELPPPAGLTAPPVATHSPTETVPSPQAPNSIVPVPIASPPAASELPARLQSESKPLDASAIPPPAMMLLPAPAAAPSFPVALPQGPTAPILSTSPAPGALPVSITDYSLNWQPTPDPTGQWKGEGVGAKPPAPLPKAGSLQSVAPMAPLPTVPAPLPVLPASAPPATPAAPSTVPDAQPMTPLPPPDWKEPGATETSHARMVARGQVGQPGPDPMVALVQNLCAGRAEGVDVRYTATRRLSVCFECHTGDDGKRLVRDISARPELVPYRIDFCVLVK